MSNRPRGGAVGWGTVLQIRRSLIRSQLLSLIFFIDIKSFRSHYGPGVDSASNRNEWVPAAFPGGKDGRCVRLTTLPPSCAVVMKSGNLNFLEPSGPLQACNETAFLCFCTKNYALVCIIKLYYFCFGGVFWDMKLYHWASVHECIEDGCDSILRNTGNYCSDTPQYHRRMKSLTTPLWEPQIPPCCYWFMLAIHTYYSMLFF